MSGMKCKAPFMRCGEGINGSMGSLIHMYVFKKIVEKNKLSLNNKNGPKKLRGTFSFRFGSRE